MDEECICCSLCSESAPEFFRESSEGGYHIVFAQPQAEREVLQVLEAMKDCPVEAIGDVGLMSAV
ncbi:MAG: ferredoxin [Verrucomicrobiota bacterium]